MNIWQWLFPKEDWHVKAKFEILVRRLLHGHCGYEYDYNKFRRRGPKP